MHTSWTLTVLWSLLFLGGVPAWSGGVSGPGGLVPGWSGPGGCLARYPPMDRILDTCLWKYYLGQNFILAGNEVSMWSGSKVIVWTDGHTESKTDTQTDTTENITYPHTRVVIMLHKTTMCQSNESSFLMLGLTNLTVHKVIWVEIYILPWYLKCL